VFSHDLVFWRGPSGDVIAAADRCAHRKTALSTGIVKNGGLVCPNHGWVFGDNGRCVGKPSGLPPANKDNLSTLPSAEAYGLVWVCLREPDGHIIDVPWENTPSYRRIESGVWQWQAPASRIMEQALAASPADASISFDLPFTCTTHTQLSDGAMQIRLLSCSPVDSRRSLVASVVWTNDLSQSDSVARQARIDAEDLRLRAERDPYEDSGTQDALTGYDDGTPLARWRRRLADLFERSAT
jgi:nitrite reductase/ring-hydroxylating ferredoxin subunit